MHICQGVCSKQFFYEGFLSNPGRVAWLLTPPASFNSLANEALNFGIEQMRDILELDHFTIKKGKPVIDYKLIALKMRAIALLDLRVKGAPTQKTMTLNTHAIISNTPNSRLDAQEVTDLAEEMSMAELERRIRDMDKRERKAQHLEEATAIDVTPVED